MNNPWYLIRSMAWHWRTKLAAALGAALATAAITGSLLTGYSVRQSLLTLVEARRGATDYTLTGRGYFRADLAKIFQPDWSSCAIIVIEGTAGGRAVTVFGIDDGFYRFHGRDGAVPPAGEAVLSRALARAIEAKPGATVQVLVEKPALIPRESPQGEKRDTGVVLPVRVAAAVSPANLDDFSIRAQQGEVMAVFVPLAWLQSRLGMEGKANLVLLAGTRGGRALADRLRAKFRLEDAGLRLRRRPANDEVVLEHESTILDDRTAERALETARELGVLARPAVVSWVPTIATKQHSIAYSMVAALDDASLAEIHDDQPLPKTKKPPILLNDWAAMDLGVKRGDPVWLEFPRNGQPERAEFELAGVVTIAGLAADRDFVPSFPGLSDRKEISRWGGPFIVDGRRVKPRDQMYWQLYGATPKAWIPLAAGRKFWGTRFGSYTSVRFMQDDPELDDLLRADIDPMAGHFAFRAVRRESLEAAAGSTDFGEYFIYFNSFVVFAALLMTVLILRLGVELRAGETALWLALGSEPKPVLLRFVAEGVVVGVVGTAAGVLLAPAYAAFMVLGLKTWWNGAAGTQLLHLGLSGRLMAEGALAGALAAAAAVWMALQNWEGLAPVVFHIGERAEGEAPRWVRPAAWATAGAAVVLGGLAAARVTAARPAWFAAGACLLGSFLLWSDWGLHELRPALVGIPGKRALLRLAVRNAGWRRRRSLLVLMLIAPCAFLLVSMEMIRQRERPAGTGGYRLYAESVAPVLGDFGLKDVVRFRVRPGDDVSGRNLYRPKDPRILGVPEGFLRSNGFQFTESTGESAETQANPWLLLESQMNAGTIPAIVDQNSLAYVLHKKVGDELDLAREGAPPVKLRLVAALRDSVFQGELLISEKNFMRLYPQVAGWRAFLLNGPPGTTARLRKELARYGFQVGPSVERLAAFHRVENTYLNAFQVLGAFGLLLGTLGLGVVMVRNGWERRRELAMLRAGGFTLQQMVKLLAGESGALLAAGLAGGLVCGVVAAGPAIGWPVLGMAAGLVGILAGGLVVAWLVAGWAIRMNNRRGWFV